MTQRRELLRKIDSTSEEPLRRWGTEERRGGVDSQPSEPVGKSADGYPGASIVYILSILKYTVDTFA